MAFGYVSKGGLRPTGFTPPKRRKIRDADAMGTE
jgi:hypothetical protein